MSRLDDAMAKARAALDDPKTTHAERARLQTMLQNAAFASGRERGRAEAELERFIDERWPAAVARARLSADDQFEEAAKRLREIVDDEDATDDEKRRARKALKVLEDDRDAKALAQLPPEQQRAIMAMGRTPGWSGSFR